MQPRSILSATAVFATLVLSGALATTHAQDTPQTPDTPPGQEQRDSGAIEVPPADTLTPKKRFEIYRQYRERDVFVTAGKGLKAVKVGDPFTKALKAWGRPREKKGSSLFGVQRWYYIADYWTRIRLTGHKRIEAIAVSGRPGSPYHTAEGAGFGMPLSQVVAYYGNIPAAPDDGGAAAADRRLDYPRKGIRFRFEQGILREFEVFAPESP